MKNILVVACMRDLEICKKFIKSFYMSEFEKKLTVIWLEDSATPNLGCETISYKEFTNVRLMNDGYILQQALKLVYANFINDDYIVMDCKDILIGSIPQSFGWPKKQYPINEKQYSHYIDSAKLFKIKEKRIFKIKNIVDTITPFTIRADIARELISLLKLKYQDEDFVNIFKKLRKNSDITEFLMYYFFSLSKNTTLTDQEYTDNIFPNWDSKIIKLWKIDDINKISYEDINNAWLIGAPNTLRTALRDNLLFNKINIFI